MDTYDQEAKEIIEHVASELQKFNSDNGIAFTKRILRRVAEQQKEKDAKIAEDYSAEFSESASPYVVGLGVAAAIREKGNKR